MGYKIQTKDKILKFMCPQCGYKFKNQFDLDFDEDERVLVCPDCGEFIEDGDNEWEGAKNKNDTEYRPG